MPGWDRTTLVTTGLASSDVARGSPRAWTCRVTSGPDLGREVRVGATAVVVGADEGCGLRLTDATVSRRHAELRLTSQGLAVRDLGSKNGTFHQGSRLNDAVVPDGAHVRFGDSSVRVEREPAPTVAPSTRASFGALVGDSAAMREAFAVLELAAPTDATVLIEGESGTGKELAAQALHDHSLRAAAPFVVVDCSAVGESLLDSQLFGHKKGAFTGAAADRKGAFVEATGGTVFLDEIGELPLPAQGKLLRALEARTVQPLGADQPVRVDVRVVAATNRELAAMVEAGTFRFDLFHRLAVIHLRVPPLRERPDDLPALVRAFYRGRGVDPGPLAGDNLERLRGYAWPGNVRELRNVLERAWVMAGPDGRPFAELHLQLGAGRRAAAPTEAEIDLDVPLKEAREHWVERFERRYLEAAFAACGQNVTRTAERVGMGRRHLRALLDKYGLKEPGPR